MAKSESDGKALAPKEDNALAELGLDIEQMKQDAQKDGAMSVADISIPYLYVLQANSPQVNEDSEKYIDGAKSGMYYLTVLDRVFDGRNEGIELIFCYYDKNINEWIPRDDGGGLVAVHSMESGIMSQAKPDDKGRPVLPNGHQLVETANHYCLIKVDNKWVQCLFPMKSTALKTSRKLNSIISTTNIPGTETRAPRYLYRYNFKTQKEQKDDQIWSSPVVGEQLGLVSKEQYNAARSYAEIAQQGILRMSAADSAEPSNDAGNASSDVM